MIKFIGNCSPIIDWQNVVNDLSTKKPGYIGPRHRSTDNVIGIADISNKWQAAGYRLAVDGGSAGWDMFFPYEHFDNKIVDVFCTWVKIKPVNAWISRVNPGMVAPWHWDANDAEEEYSKKQPMLRFSCHISLPSPGHVFIVDDHCFYNEAQGNTYQWPSRKSWHGGSNCGLVPKYIFNVFGEKI